jgi:acetyl esterase/lipase
LWLTLVTTTAATAQDADISVLRDIPYRTVVGTTLRLDAYLPGGTGPHPAVLVIPGGKWVHGSKDKKTWLPTDLASRGYAAFAVNYRPATEAPFPAAIEDVQAAVRYVRAHASRFDIDPTRFGAVGGSAGGNLAALLATWGEGPTDTGARVNAAVSWSGPMELDRLLDAPNEEVRTAVRTFLGCSASERCLEQARAASPATHVDPSDGAVFLGNFTDEEIPVDQATRMAEVLEASGVPVQLVEPTGNNHGLGQNDKTLNYVATFLGTWIAGPDAGGPSPSPSAGQGAVKSGSSQPSTAPPATGAVKHPNASGEPIRRVATPWWAIAAIALALLAALASLFVTVALYRRLRLGERPEGSEQDGNGDGPDSPDDRDVTLAARGTDHSG